VALITDARFSGVSTGACIGHVGPEALAGGPIGKLRDGDWIRIVIDRRKLTGSIDFIGEGPARPITDPPITAPPITAPLITAPLITAPLITAPLITAPLTPAEGAAVLASRPSRTDLAPASGL